MIRGMRRLLVERLLRQGGACFYCGCGLVVGPADGPADRQQELDVAAQRRLKVARIATPDHFVPVFAGGAHAPENIVAACAPCNVDKAARLPTLAEMLRFVEQACVPIDRRTPRSGPLTASFTYRAALTIDVGLAQASTSDVGAGLVPARRRAGTRPAPTSAGPAS